MYVHRMLMCVELARCGSEQRGRLGRARELHYRAKCDHAGEYIRRSLLTGYHYDTPNVSTLYIARSLPEYALTLSMTPTLANNARMHLSQPSYLYPSYCVRSYFARSHAG